MDPRRQRNIGLLQERWEDLQVVWRLIQDREVSLALKLIPILAVLYLLSPIDIVPDFMLGIGQIDDLTILVVALATFLRLVPPANVERARGNLSGEGPWVEGEAHPKPDEES